MSQVEQNLSLSRDSCSSQVISEPKKHYSYIPGEKNGKWSDQEHMRYIVFIDFNKEKMRSKEKRRSNKFYKEMSRFISTRNALQCRSHHQKLQEKYAYVNKIISIYKITFDKTLYKEAYEKLAIQLTEKHSQPTIFRQASQIQSRQMATQTEIQGINLGFFYVNNNTIIVQAPHAPSNYQFFIPNVHQYPHGVIWNGPIYSTLNGE